ncbi:MAG TPA: TlyA family RNA methyltransferase [Chthoniobacterales bacterium]
MKQSLHSNKIPKLRLDQLLVERGLCASREKAQRLILAGSVRVHAAPAAKPGQLVPADAVVELLAAERYVGRGGTKLEAALAHFQVPVQGAVCADLGASTGGFTDCLLQHGAARVHAIDVGRGQLDWKLRQDPRVIVREGINARRLTVADLGERVALAVADVSFISLALILPAAFDLLVPGGRMIVLIKPQFELTKSQVGKGGIVRDEALQLSAVEKIRGVAEQALGRRWGGFIPSPILGAKGNREFLALLET